MDSTVKEGRFQGVEGGHPRRPFLGEVKGSRTGWTQELSRRICRVLVSLQVRPNLKWKRRLEDEVPTHKMTKQNELG